MEERPSRPRFVPPWLIPLAVAGILVIAGAVTAIVLIATAPESVVVPDVTGMAESEARGLLQSDGLTLTRASTRFSVEVPQGTVISQDPPAGTRLDPGEAVLVVVSAGAERVTVPDLIGDSAETARIDLTEIGLAYEVTSVESTAPVGTVVGLDPSPGTEVELGSVVRIVVVQRSTGSDALAPYALSGTQILLDSVAGTAESEVTLEVERRLRSLLEASGATVSVTRTAAGASADPTTRSRAVIATTAAVVITLDVRTEGDPGLEIVLLPRDLASTASRARRLADELLATLGELGQAAPALHAADDVVLAAAPCPAVRVVLGNTAEDADTVRFNDPEWLDEVAQAMYRAIGSVFATTGTD